MEMGSLQITVLKGPKNGETLVCKPGSKTLKIGRVIKGNHFALRDPGISQKHLCFQFVPETSTWFVSDLDSSNGTILNGSKIESLVPVPISDRDVIKIGERSELGVKIVSPELLKENEEENGNVKRKGVSTRARTSRVSNEEEKMEKTLDPDFVCDMVVTRAQKGKGKSRTKIDKEKENSNSILGNKTDEKRDLGIFSSEETENSDQSKGVKLRRNRRRGNSSSRVLRELDNNCAVNLGSGEKAAHMKKKESGKGKEMFNGNEKILLETENENCDSDFKARKRVNSSMVPEEKKVEKDIGIKEGLEANYKETGDHFEKMMLEQWFDSMELFLPKIIHDESEEIINILRERARKFEEFIETGGNR